MAHDLDINRDGETADTSKRGGRSNKRPRADTDGSPLGDAVACDGVKQQGARATPESARRSACRRARKAESEDNPICPKGCATHACSATANPPPRDREHACEDEPRRSHSEVGGEHVAVDGRRGHQIESRRRIDTQDCEPAVVGERATGVARSNSSTSPARRASCAASHPLLSRRAPLGMCTWFGLAAPAPGSAAPQWTSWTSPLASPPRRPAEWQSAKRSQVASVITCAGTPLAHSVQPEGGSDGHGSRRARSAQRGDW